MGTNEVWGLSPKGDEQAIDAYKKARQGMSLDECEIILLILLQDAIARIVLNQGKSVEYVSMVLDKLHSNLDEESDADDD